MEVALEGGWESLGTIWGLRSCLEVEGVGVSAGGFHCFFTCKSADSFICL